MSEFSGYVLTVFSAALICGILNGLMKDTFCKSQIRLLTSLFLTITIISPLLHMDFSLPTDFDDSIFLEAEAVASEGAAVSGKEILEVIKTGAEAYILTKAEALNAEITAEVAIREGDQPVPESVILHGNVSDGVRKILTEIIAKDLGIAKENQIWIGKDS